MNLCRCATLASLLLALTIVGCVSAQSWEAVRVLEDIEVGGGASELKSMTPTPSRTSIAYKVGQRVHVADLYEPNQPIGAGLVLVPGFTPLGKDNPRLIALALSLSRARFLVLVPDLQGSREMRVRLEDARSIADAVVYLAQIGHLADHEGVGVVAISYAVGLAILATMQPDAKDKVRFLVSIGGYYDTTAVVTFITTGKYREPAAGNWRTARPFPAAKWIFLAGNIDLLNDRTDRENLAAIVERRLRKPDAPVGDFAARLSPEGRVLFELLTNTNPERVDGLLKKLPGALQGHMKTLSLSSYDLSHLAGRLILIHGREDTMIPYTESLALESVVAGSELFIINGFSHIDPTALGLIARLQLVDAVYAVLERRLN